jgi:hypothetical protein
MKFAFDFPDREVVHAGEPPPHETVVVEFPVLVPISAKPVERIIVPFISEADGNPVTLKGPQLFD